MATAFGLLLAVVRFFLGRKAPTADQVKLKEAQTVVEQVRNQNEMRQDIANRDADDIDRQLREPWVK